MAEPDGTLGTVCIYEATSPEAIQKHANRAELALSEIRPIVDTVLVRARPGEVERTTLAAGRP